MEEEVRSSRGPLWNGFFWWGQGHHIYEITVPVTAYSRPSQYLAIQTSSTDSERFMKSQPYLSGVSFGLAVCFSYLFGDHIFSKIFFLKARFHISYLSVSTVTVPVCTHTSTKAVWEKICWLLGEEESVYFEFGPWYVPVNGPVLVYILDAQSGFSRF